MSEPTRTVRIEDTRIYEVEVYEYMSAEAIYEAYCLGEIDVSGDEVDADTKVFFRKRVNGVDCWFEQ